MRNHRDDDSSAAIPRTPLWRRYLHFWRTDVAADVDEEVRFHLEERIASLVACGLTPADAQARALSEFGDVDAVRATLRGIGERRERRHVRASRWEALAYDLKLALRALRSARGVSLAIVVTLALGLGANVAVFTLLDRVLLRVPAAIRDPDGVRRLYVTHDYVREHKRTAIFSFNYAEFLDIRRAVGHGAHVAAFGTPLQLRLGRGVDAPTLEVVSANADYFVLLGVRPALGRFFAGDELQIEAEPPRVVILGHALWKTRFGADSTIVGRQIVLDRNTFVVVGVAPSEFVGDDISAVDAWIPLGWEHSFSTQWGSGKRRIRGRHGSTLSVLARMTAGNDERAMLARATTAIRNGDLGDEPGGYIDRGATVLSGPVIAALGPGGMGQGISAAFRVGVVALAVLLIACANVANLLLARAHQRRREIAVRLALGVSRIRLVRQLLLEGLVLSLLAGVAAVFIGTLTGSALRAILMPDGHWAGSAVDARIVITGALLALLAGLLSALAPAVIASRSDLNAFLKLGVRGGVVQRGRFRATLIVLQAAISVTLLAGAALFLKTIANLKAIDVGYDVSHLVFGTVHFMGTGDAPLSVAQQTRQLERLRAGLARVDREIAGAAGVERTARTINMPFYGYSVSPLRLPGRDSVPTLHGDIASYVAASPEYFAATGLVIRRGRGITPTDDAIAARVVVVNETMARTFWPEREAVGNCIMIGDHDSSCVTVVGVAADAHRIAVIEPPTMIYYLPLAQMPLNEVAYGQTLLVRGTPKALPRISAALARSLWKEFNTEAETRTFIMDDLLASQFEALRGTTRLITALAALALLVAASGIYATVAHGVSHRRHELGVRVALGARTTDIVRLVVAGGLQIVAIGVLVGVALALAGGQLVASMLYGISARDPRVLIAVSLVLLLMALLASALPAWRAARTDPLEALRAE